MKVIYIIQLTYRIYLYYICASVLGDACPRSDWVHQCFDKVDSLCIRDLLVPFAEPLKILKSRRQGTSWHSWLLAVSRCSVEDDKCLYALHLFISCRFKRFPRSNVREGGPQSHSTMPHYFIDAERAIIATFCNCFFHRIPARRHSENGGAKPTRSYAIVASQAAPSFCREAPRWDGFAVVMIAIIRVIHGRRHSCMCFSRFHLWQQ